MGVLKHLEGVCRPSARICALHQLCLHLAVVGLLDVGPLGPLVGGSADLGRGRQELQLVDALCVLAQRRCNAVGAGVATADNHHVLAFGAHRRRFRMTVEQGLSLRRKVVHSKDHVRVVRTGDAQAARLSCARSHNHGVEARKLSRNLGRGGVGTAANLDAVLLHEVEPALDDLLGKLHVGNSIHEKAARTVMALEERHARAAARELPRRSQAGGAGPNHGDAGCVLSGRRKRRGAARSPLVIGDGTLVVLDGGGLVLKAQVARGLAGSGAHAARELGERVGERQALSGVGPHAAPHEVVPLGDQVVQRASRAASLAKREARLAERDAAVHAAACLRALVLLVQRHRELPKVLERLGCGPLAVGDPSEVDVCSDLAHGLTSRSSWSRRRSQSPRRGSCPRPRRPR